MSVLVSGHRGAAGLCPENTLLGVRCAVAMGVDFVECDVRLSADGRVVVMHDAAVDRTTDGAGLVAEMDLAELRALDAGRGERAPLLEEVVDMVRGRCELLCDLKCAAAVDAAAEVVEARGRADSVTFISFEWARLERVRALGGKYRVSGLVETLDDVVLAASAALGAEWIDLRHTAITAETVARARDAGLRVRAWTPNEAVEFARLARLGVDAITTDRPDHLLEALRCADA